MLPNDSSLATLTSLSPHHHNPLGLPSSISHPDTISFEAGVSHHLPSLSPPGLSRSPQDPTVSPKTPEQGTFTEWNVHDPSKRNSTSSNHHKPFDRYLGSQNDKASSQGTPGFSLERLQPHRTDLLTSSRLTSLGEKPAEGDPVAQIPLEHISSRSRRKQNQQFKCISCSKVYPRRCDLNKHLKSHERAFRCNITGCSHTQGFALPKDLRRHIDTIHRKSTFTCYFPDCGEQFSRSDNCQRHFDEQHSQ